MFYWNDPKLEYETITRDTGSILVEHEQFKIIKIGDRLIIDTRDHYGSQTLLRVLEGHYTPTQLIALVSSGQVFHLVDPKPNVDDGELTDSAKAALKSQYERCRGNLSVAVDVSLVKKHWAELFVCGAIDEFNHDGTVAKDIAISIRDHYGLSIDPSEPMNYYEYSVYLYTMRNTEQCDVSVHMGDTVFAGELDGIEFDSDWMRGPYVRFEVETYTTFRGEIRVESSWVTIFGRGFEPITIDNAKVRPLTSEIKTQMAERGQQILDSVSESGTSFTHYEGEALVPFFFGPYPEYVNDRIVVDPVSLYTVNTSQYRNMVSELGFDSDGQINVKNKFDASLIDSDKLHQLFPYSFGYVFATKKWAMLDLSNSRPINFRQDAIDKLVLEESKKKMLLAMITNNVAENNDIVDGKGGGVITLLHGAPGLGKTLAAEVMAEYTKKPLYKVSVGELGTSPDELESRLSQILNIATRWNAVLLIDEADIFLEERTTNDIARNAMVAIFLRLLEYYEGVLFLTTNRVKNFDPAFYSRIMLSFGFDELQSESRCKVWNNLLSNNNLEMSVEDMAVLGEYDEVNARQIKNAINGARALALSEGTDVSVHHITAILDNTTQFLKDVKK